MKSLTALTLVALAVIAGAAQADMAKARQLFNDNQYSEAQAEFNTLYKDKSSKAEAAFYLGRIAMKNNAMADALDYLEDAVDGRPDDAQAQFRYAQASCIRATEVSILRAAGFAGDCRDAAVIAIKLDPRLWEARELLMDFYLRAPGLMGGGQDKADALLKETAALDKEHATILEAKVAASAKQYEKATQLLVNLADTHADNADYRHQAGLLYTQLEKYVEAQQQFCVMSERFPDDARAPYQLGRVAVLSKNPQMYVEGEAGFKKYFQLPRDDKAPDPAWAWFRLGELYELMAKTDEAKAAFASARKNNPDERLQGELKKKKA